MTRLRVPAVLLLAAAGCVGNIGDRADGAGPGGHTPGGTSDELNLGASDLRRLTLAEYDRSLRSLFGDAAADDAMVAISALPTDQVKNGFTSMALGVSATHVDGWFGVADRISTYLASDPARRADLEPCLADQPGDEACMKSFLANLGRRVYRRPLTDDETSMVLGAHAAGKALTPEDGVALAIFAMLQAPAFLYRVEIEGAAVPEIEDAYALTDWELATRLAYFATGTTPDDELLDAAEAGELATQTGLDAQIDRLFAGDQAVTLVRAFFSEWLGLDHMPNPQQSDAFLAGIPKDTLADDVREELLRYVDLQVFETSTDYAGLMTSGAAFVTAEPVGQIYGVAVPGDPSGKLDLPAAQRSGLLTRAAVLIGAGEQTHPVQRGAFVLRKLLCVDIAPPDPSKFPPNTIVPPPFDADTAARDRWTEKTSAPMCAACHGQINPYGFALENYDTIGRWRDKEPILDPVDGTLVNELPIDASVDVQIDGATVKAGGGVGLDEVLAASPQANACFAKQWFRFSEGRLEASEDAAALAKLVETGTGPGGTMLEMFKRLARTPQFRMRKAKP